MADLQLVLCTKRWIALAFSMKGIFVVVCGRRLLISSQVGVEALRSFAGFGCAVVDNQTTVDGLEILS